MDQIVRVDNLPKFLVLRILGVFTAAFRIKIFGHKFPQPEPDCFTLSLPTLLLTIKLESPS